jgi:Domain of unknown function (DUF5658)
MVTATPRRQMVPERGLRGALARLVAAVRAGLSSRWGLPLSVAFLVGQACDVVTTHVALASGRFQEANPVFAPALASNEVVALLVKLSLAGLVLLAALTKLTGTRRTAVLAVLVFISLEAPLTNGLRLLGVL